MPIGIFSLDITRFAFANANHFRVIRKSILKLIRKIFVKYMHACVICVFSKIWGKFANQFFQTVSRPDWQ